MFYYRHRARVFACSFEHTRVCAYRVTHALAYAFAHRIAHRIAYAFTHRISHKLAHAVAHELAHGLADATSNQAAHRDAYKIPLDFSNYVTNCVTNAAAYTRNVCVLLRGVGNGSSHSVCQFTERRSGVLLYT